MINLSTTTIVNPYIMGTVVEELFGENVGLSTGPYGSIIHLPDETYLSEATDLLNNYGQLNVTADKFTVIADGSDTVTLTAVSNSDIQYFAVVNGVAYATGVATPTANVVNIEFATDIEGTYMIMLKSDNYSTGYVEIEATNE